MERTLGWTAEIVRHPPKPAPMEVMMRWVREFEIEGLAIDPKRFISEQDPSCRAALGCGEDLFLALTEQEDELRDYERLPESAEAFIYGSYEPPDGELIGTLMRVFRQFLNWTLAICEGKG